MPLSDQCRWSHRAAGCIYLRAGSCIGVRSGPRYSVCTMKPAPFGFAFTAVPVTRFGSAISRFAQGLNIGVDGGNQCLHRGKARLTTNDRREPQFDFVSGYVVVEIKDVSFDLCVFAVEGLPCWIRNLRRCGGQLAYVHRAGSKFEKIALSPRLPTPRGIRNPIHPESGLVRMAPCGPAHGVHFRQVSVLGAD
jgi:hypothetical protein